MRSINEVHPSSRFVGFLLLCSQNNLFLREVSALCRFLEFVEQSGQFFHAATLIALDATACGYSDFILSKGATIPQLS